MKKRLLLQAVALMCAVGSYAYEVGEYIYTPEAKFKVTDANKVINGDFSQGIGVGGWADVNGDEVDTEIWANGGAVGPNGENVRKCIGKTADEGEELTNIWSLSPGSYVISYAIKSEAGSGATSVTAGGDNYIDFFVNIDGSRAKGTKADGEAYPRSVAETMNFTDQEWKFYNDTVNINVGEYLVFHATNCATGLMLTNFTIQPVSQIYDDRIIRRRLAFAEMLLARPEADFPDEEAREELLDIVDHINEVLSGEDKTTNIESVQAMNGEMSDLEMAIQNFLDLNTAPISTGLSWAGAGNVQKAGWVRSWYGTGGRWFHGNNGIPDDEEACMNYMPGAFEFTNGVISYIYGLSKFDEETEYMFTMDLKGFHYMGNSTSTGSATTPNYDAPFIGAWLKAGAPKDETSDVKDIAGQGTYPEESVLCCDTLDTRNYNTYTIFVKVPAGQKRVEFLAESTRADDNIRGGAFFCSTPRVYQLHTSVVKNDYWNEVAAVIVQQKALADRFTYIADDLAKTKADGFPWGKAALTDSLNKYKPLYEASLAVIDAEGNVVSEELSNIAKTSTDSLKVWEADLLAAVKTLNTARNAYNNLNAKYTQLQTSVANGEELATKYAGKGNATREQKLNALLAEGKQLIEAAAEVDPETDTEAGNAAAAKAVEIDYARVSFHNSFAVYSNSSEQIIANPNFASNLNGWTASTDNNNGAFKRNSDANRGWLAGTGAGAWRGNTASPNNKMVQTITISDAGVYEYKASAYGFNEVNAQDSPMAYFITNEDGVNIDTLYTNSELKLFFGSDGVADSVRIHSHYGPATNNYAMTYSAADATVRTGYWCSPYSVVYIKTQEGEETVELGMSTMGNIGKAGANTFGFGDNQILFGGSVDAYTTAAKADLSSLIEQAEQLISTNENSANGTVVGRLGRMSRRLADAEKALAGEALAQYTNGSSDGVAPVDEQTQLLKNILNTRNYLAETINDVQVALGIELGIDTPQYMPTQAQMAQGVYTISGQRVSNVKSLRPGLYIVAGKKFFVK